jgi:HK97 family phage major capsid protein
MIPLGEIYANLPMSQRMLDDAEQAEPYAMDTIADQFAQQEGPAFLTGDGNQKPRGLLTYPTATTNDFTRAFGTLQYRPTGAAGAFVAAPNGGDCLVNLVADLRPRYRQHPSVAWLMSSSTQAAVRLIKDSQGRPLYVPGLLESEPDRLLGYPVAIDENMPAIAANSFSVAFGAWFRGYVIADHRVGTRILRDPFTAKPNVLFYATRRVGAALYNSEAIKLLKFSVS